MYGQQIGPVKRVISKIIIGGALKNVDLLGVRDKKSIKEAMLLGVDSANVFYSGDEGAYLTPSADEVAINFLMEAGVPKEFIAVHFRIDENCPFERYIDNYVGLIGKICQDLHINNIVLIPMSYSKNDTDDLAAIKLLEKKLKQVAFILDIGPKPDLTKAILKKASFAVGLANHFCIFSLSVGTPTVGVFATEYMKQKLSGIKEAYTGFECLSVAKFTDTDPKINQLLQSIKHGNAHVCFRHSSNEFGKPDGYNNLAKVVS
ncbi:polysaccharide pyruvyl transferase family protein [Endozoicomonas sp. YOMI1]|uniref:polysaccharide pyruvyl transferase family protein n=1 Tax=Endozoicomonas sp. YOMI1 TaxID=2828739 RepID=UPI002149076A|nr:polysaccharide pyruvyl transferase family protein [Endozoicomonas sp. YOMI1]